MSKNTYYIHSTGIIKRPNPTRNSGKYGAKNKARAEWGNLFTSERAAKKAQKRVQKAIAGKRWWQS